MVSRPRLSIVLPVRNAAAILPATLKSLELQSYQNFEVLVVDGQSTDGTLDLLADASRRLPLQIVSEPDGSIAEAYAKGLRRANADLVGMSSADERYYPDAFSTVCAWFDEYPDTVACCGRSDLIDNRGLVTKGFANTTFDLPSHLSCEVVLPISATFFNRALLAANLRYDATRPTCPDYEFWGRLAFTYPSGSVKLFEDSVVAALATRDSMSFRAESFEPFTRDKISHLDGLLESFVPSEERAPLRKRSVAGIHMWAAEQLFALEPDHPNILEHCKRAASSDAKYRRIAEFLERTSLATIDTATGSISPIPRTPGWSAHAVASSANITVPAYWEGAQVLTKSPLTIRTAAQSWGYSAIANAPTDITATGLLWLALDLEVLEGSVGIARFVGGKIFGERLLDASRGRVTINIPLLEGANCAIMVRSGADANSLVKIHSSRYLIEPRGLAKLGSLLRLFHSVVVRNDK